MRIIEKLTSVILLSGFCWMNANCTASKAPTAPAAKPQEIQTPQEKLVRMLPIRSDQDFAIVFTSSVQGNVKPCGCTADPLGGIARIASVMQGLRKHYKDQLLFLDTGDLLFEKTSVRPAVEKCQDDARIELLLSTFKDLGLAHTLRGPRDLAAGNDAYEDWMNDHQIHHAAMPVVSTIQKVGTQDIGLLALLPDEAMSLTQRQEALDGALETMKKQRVAQVIVMSQLPLQLLRQLSWNTYPVTAILQGHESGEAPQKPQRLNADGPYILFNGIQGQYLGVLHFSWKPDDLKSKLQPDLSFFEVDADKKLLQLRIEGLEKRMQGARVSKQQKQFFQGRIASAVKRLHELKSLSPALPNEAVLRLFSWSIRQEIEPLEGVASAVKAYEDQIPALVAQCESGMECELPEEGDAVYVGVQTCVSCHKAAVQQWRGALIEGQKSKSGKIGHAKAWQTLEELHKTRDRQCVGCHSVGFNEPGGYCKTDQVGFLENVQCESCHGPGSLHAQTGDPSLIMKEVPQEACRECHHVPHIESYASFDYNEKLKIILGPGHGEKKWRTLMGNTKIDH